RRREGIGAFRSARSSQSGGRLRSRGKLAEITADGWPAFDATQTQAHVPHEGHIYKGANHGFHNDTTPRYDEAAAKEAWQRTLAWFDTYLRA
ncbi:MAG: carboxymethylenebutenolidase, partial [Acetobacteraceae bacterium]|nr:carboxymethylenebutenolidase [Acetobacteraceae bacterium]